MRPPRPGPYEPFLSSAEPSPPRFLCQSLSFARWSRWTHPWTEARGDASFFTNVTVMTHGTNRVLVSPAGVTLERAGRAVTDLAHDLDRTVAVRAERHLGPG